MGRMAEMAERGRRITHGPFLPQAGHLGQQAAHGQLQGVGTAAKEPRRPATPHAGKEQPLHAEPDLPRRSID